MKKITKASLLGLSLLTLTGCGLFNRWTGTVTEIEQEDYSSVVYEDYSRQMNYNFGYETPVLPSVGDVTALVIPIEFTDYPFSEQTITDINTAFNGTAEDTGYWHSVSSYYQESSFGRLNLSFVIADVYDSGVSTEIYLPYDLSESTSQQRIEALCTLAYEDYISSSSGASIDGNNDGYADAVYFIYSAPDSSNPSAGEILNSELWAYCTTHLNGPGTHEKPSYSNYFWASYDFMYRHWRYSRATPIYQEGMVDCHTYIHESGHLFGLVDYYNYNVDDYEYDEYRNGSAFGKVDMMDYNVGDHNSWSKFALGWVKPYVVDDRYSFPLSVELSPYIETGEFILIPSSLDYNGTAFDEYIMVEFVTPSGVASVDAESSYAGSYPTFFSRKGIRISHVDARLANVFPSEGGYRGSYEEPTKSDLENSSVASFYRMAASNTPSYCLFDNNHRQLSLISSDPDTVFMDEDVTADNNDLFTVGDSFNLSDYRENFNQNRYGYYFNDGNSFPFDIKVEAIGDTAILTISVA